MRRSRRNPLRDQRLGKWVPLPLHFSSYPLIVIFSFSRKRSLVSWESWFNFFAFSFFLQHRKVWNCLGLIDSITAISFQVLHNTHLANDVDCKCSECYDQQKYQQSHPSHIKIVANVAGAKTNHLEGNPMFQRRDSHLTLICPEQAISPFFSHSISIKKLNSSSSWLRKNYLNNASWMH